MPRTPKPWYWKKRRSYFVTIDGKRHCLGRDKEAAFVLFHQLMAEPQQQVIHSGSLIDIFERFLDWTDKHRTPDTYEWYRFRLERFLKKYPNLQVHQLKPYHVQEWIDEMEGLASGSRKNYCRAVKRCLRWCKQQGYISENPISDMAVPRGGQRNTVISQEEFQKLLTAINSSEFQDLLTVTWETGCRPQESLIVEARHVQLQQRRWVFAGNEAKGDFGRAIYLTDEALAITKKLMTKHPKGTLFRNTQGDFWTPEAVNCHFVRLQQKLGMAKAKEQGLEPSDREIKKFAKTLAPTRKTKGVEIKKTERELYVESRRKLRAKQAVKLVPKYCLYTLRHSWATHALERGVDSLTVSVLMGHKDPSTLAKVYQHLTHNPDYLLEQVRKAAG